MLSALGWLIVSIVGGLTASITGFGIGSLLTPLLATRISVADAVLAVSIPHAIATAIRCWRLRHAIRRDLLKGFGIASAVGGLIGAFALLSFRPIAAIVLGILLIATGSAGLSAWNRRVHPGKSVATVLGALSGLFGGIAGNQGGLRAAALTAFDLTPAEFVATSTAVGLMVDAGRLPVYLIRDHHAISGMAVIMGIATIGVIIGTVAGERILLQFSRKRYQQALSTLILILGVWVLIDALR
ncbi:MAG TPA: sulfite exporter TauE/SafE family protein [Gemmatimonadaceae bacterium]